MARRIKCTQCDGRRVTIRAVEPGKVQVRQVPASVSTSSGATPPPIAGLTHAQIASLVSVRKEVESLESVVILCQAPALEVLYVDIEEPLPV